MSANKLYSNYCYFMIYTSRYVFHVLIAARKQLRLTSMVDNIADNMADEIVDRMTDNMANNIANNRS